MKRKSLEPFGPRLNLSISGDYASSLPASFS